MKLLEELFINAELLKLSQGVSKNLKKVQDSLFPSHRPRIEMSTKKFISIQRKNLTFMGSFDFLLFE